MAKMIRDGFILPQVWVEKRETKMIEVLGRLCLARIEYAENIFGGEKYMEGNTAKRDYAIVTLALSNGKGKTRKTAKYNFNPDNFFALRRECEPAINYHRSYAKEFKKRNCVNGIITERTITIRFEYYRKKNGQFDLDKNGQKQVSNYPWYIGVSERTGQADTQGAKIVKELNKTQEYILLTSDEYQSMLDSTCRYIDVFSMAFGPALLREKAKLAGAKREEYLKKKEQG